MDRNYFEEYLQIVGNTVPDTYKSAEEEASKIEKCTILKNVDISYSNEIAGYDHNDQQRILI